MSRCSKEKKFRLTSNALWEFACVHRSVCTGMNEDEAVRLQRGRYLASTLTAIVTGYKQQRIGRLLPWNYPARQPAFVRMLGQRKGMI